MTQATQRLKAIAAAETAESQKEIEKKVRRHNAVVKRAKSFTSIDTKHPDFLKKAPPGYSFNITHELIPKTKK